MFQGIRGKIIYNYLFLILISMLVVGVSLIWMLQNYLLDNVEDNMTNQGRLIADVVSEEVSLGNYDKVQEKVIQLASDLNLRITIVLKDGRVIGDSESDPDSMENHKNRIEISQALQKQVGIDKRMSSTTEIDTMYVAVPIINQGEVLGAARIGLPLQEINRTFLKVRGFMFIGILIATLIAILISLKLAKGFTEPIASISRGARKIAAGDLTTRVYSGLRDEIGELGLAINDMTKTLQQHIEEISQEKSRLENILATIASGVIMLDKFGFIRVVNPAAEEMFGINALIAEGKQNVEVIRNFGLNQEIENCILQEKFIEYEFTLYFPEERVLQCYLAPFYRDKKIAGITIVFHDITKIRKVEQMRADFVANASHELRTPLTVIKGYSETLLHGALDDREHAEKFITIIDHEADRLQRLVEELLNLSHLESRRQDPLEESADLLAIIPNVGEELKPRLLDKAIFLDLDLPKGLPHVNANPDRFKQILVNLLDNAIKYSPQGSRVQVTIQEEEKTVKILVKDTGMGIPAKDLPRIFERFYRVDKARSRQMGGFGLGLSIVKHMVENMGGTIGVESEENKGSTFWFTLLKKA
ncbi:two-component system histidine kinase PnpS [Dehalobacterium formicoaceticum]|uniref:two-component system histidine kinase PnpS n=1 Tax=Dehalobacterium formicoaceticum TaxID=51515 RepID=UPI000B7EAB11|nr:ATP-binding protein [Dehalobacterium formicoaceticum]